MPPSHNRLGHCTRKAAGEPRCPFAVPHCRLQCPLYFKRAEPAMLRSIAPSDRGTEFGGGATGSSRSAAQESPITARTLLQKGSRDATLSCRQRRLQCTWHSRVRSPPTMLISIAKSKSVENVVGEPPCHLAAPPRQVQSDIASEPREAHQVEIKRAGGSEVATQSLQRGPRHHLSTPRLYRAMSDPTMGLISA